MRRLAYPLAIAAALVLAACGGAPAVDVEAEAAAARQAHLEAQLAAGREALAAGEAERALELFRDVEREEPLFPGLAEPLADAFAEVRRRQLEANRAADAAELAELEAAAEAAVERRAVVAELRLAAILAGMRPQDRKPAEATVEFCLVLLQERLGARPDLLKVEGAKQERFEWFVTLSHGESPIRCSVHQHGWFSVHADPEGSLAAGDLGAGWRSLHHSQWLTRGEVREYGTLGAGGDR